MRPPPAVDEMIRYVKMPIFHRSKPNEEEEDASDGMIRYVGKRPTSPPQPKPTPPPPPILTPQELAAQRRRRSEIRVWIALGVIDLGLNALIYGIVTCIYDKALHWSWHSHWLATQVIINVILAAIVVVYHHINTHET